MSPELLAYLREQCSVFFANEADIAADASFKKCNDYGRKCRWHKYYEGYFHSLAAGGLNAESRSPRRIDKCIPKLPAPRALRAFLEVFRRQMEKPVLNIFTPLAEAGNLGAIRIIEAIHKGWMFGDLAVQIHAGSAVPPASINWHRDRPNSV